MRHSELEAATIYDDGIAMFNEGQWAGAVTALAQVIELEPSDTDLLALAYVNRSTALSQLERAEEAFADATAAIDLQPDDIEILAAAYVSRSVDLILLERTDEAVADATAAIDLQPDNIDTLAQAYVNRSIALSKLGRLGDAAADTTTASGLQAAAIIAEAQEKARRIIEAALAVTRPVTEESILEAARREADRLIQDARAATNTLGAAELEGRRAEPERMASDQPRPRFVDRSPLRRRPPLMR
jgi:tetratricopeptide (TPR) repeat protein